MRSASTAALGRARERWEALLTQRGGEEIELARSIFALVDILRKNPALLGALEDNARAPEDRATLAHNVVHGKVADEVTELLQGLAREYWSEKDDLGRALEALGARTLMVGAQREGKLSEVEEQLYVIMRTLRENRDLRIAVGDTYFEVGRRQELVRNLFAPYLNYTVELLVRAVANTMHGYPPIRSLTYYMEMAAEQGLRIVASVTSAVPLTREQEERLTAILSRSYNKDVKVHVTIDPAVIGGIRIHVADDVIDGTLASRLRGVREAFSN